MTAFIKQEAMEKAREIEIKANEEFEIEKSKLVRQETDAIDSQYEKKFKQATMSQQITRSTVANKTRLKVLGARQELLDNIFEAAEKQLADGAKDKAKYQKILKGLILEGFYAMNEPKLQLRARKKDYDAVKKASEQAAQEYKKETGKDVEGVIHEEHPLPEGSYVTSQPSVPRPPTIAAGSKRADTQSLTQVRRRHHRWWRRQDRHRQHIRDAAGAAQGLCRPRRAPVTVWKEPEPQVRRLDISSHGARPSVETAPWETQEGGHETELRMCVYASTGLLQCFYSNRATRTYFRCCTIKHDLFQPQTPSSKHAHINSCHPSPTCLVIMGGYRPLL